MTDERSLYELMDGTPTEKNIAEDYAALLDKFSALSGAIEDGNWRYAHDKIHSVRQMLDDLERRLTRTTGNPDVLDGTQRVFQDPGADPHRTAQLVIAFAQKYGGRLGPLIHPIDGLESEAAKAKIEAGERWVAEFRAAMDAGDEEAASRLTGNQVRIVDGMTSDGGR